MADPSRAKHLEEYKWQPDQSGNPAGRPVGSRNQLGTAFIDALKKDFDTYGGYVIERVRTEKPDQYLKTIAMILPKELHVKDMSLGDMSDDELIGLLAAVRSFTAKDRRKKTEGGTGETKENEEVRGKPN